MYFSMFLKSGFLLFALVLFENKTYAFKFDSDNFETILQRLDSLEESDQTQKEEIHHLQNVKNSQQAEIDTLKQTVNNMKKHFVKRESELLAEIEKLTGKEHKISIDTADVTRDGERKRREPGDTLSRKRRYVESETAFHATSSAFTLRTMDHDETIALGRPLTNIGNAYNPGNGVFTAPVNGTYVFYFTMSNSLSDKWYYANMNVNNVHKVVIRAAPVGQSCYALVTNLAVKDTVTVTNVVANTSTYGLEFNSFSGFLLYERFEVPSTVTIVGK